MLNAIFELARPMLFALSPEDAHELTLKSLEMGVYPRPIAPDGASLAVDLWGLRFPNPIGIAAGFDKDARVVDAVLGMGCGFAEAGTTTPLAQSGNPRPRVFRLVADRGVINRLGFNNAGHAAALDRLRRRTSRGIVAVNLGANKDATDRTADYVKGIETFYDVASFFTINISSPNTPGLRDLQAPAALDELLARVMAAREALVQSGKPKRPVVVKLAPDIAEADLEPIAERLARACGRRHRRVEHDAGPRRSHRCQCPRSRRALRPPALPPLDRHAGPCPRGDRRPRAARRRRRHRQRRGGARQDRGRRHALAALYGAHL